MEKIWGYAQDSRLRNVGTRFGNMRKLPAGNRFTFSSLGVTPIVERGPKVVQESFTLLATSYFCGRHFPCLVILNPPE